MTTQKWRADRFRRLHHGNHILILPNAWDVASARLFENERFPAVATSSAGVAVSLGYRDGEAIGRKEYASAVSRMASVLQVPLSADIVAGFGRGAGEVSQTAHEVIRAGAVGVNIEDSVHAKGKLLPLDRQLAKLEALREAGLAEGIPLVINARTDALRLAKGSPDEKFGEAVRRATAYRDWGADCVYPMGLTEARSIGRFVDALDCPVNVMLRKSLPPIAELEALGVKRLSFGPSGSYAAMGLLKRASAEIRESGTYSTLTKGAITYEELNSLAVSRKRR